MTWDHRQYGTIADPIRQSDLNALTSSYACSKLFQFRKIEDSEGTRSETKCSYKRAIGSGTHQTLERILTKAKAQVLTGWVPTVEQILAVLRQEMESAAEGLPIEWRDAKPDEELDDAVHMIRGAVRTLGERAADIVLVEAPFTLVVVRDAKEYYLRGTIDVAYRPKDDPTALALVDWKTGEQLMSQVVLDHGYQFGVYADALLRGTFYPGEAREHVLGEYPRDIHVAHLRDFVPYMKAGTKGPTRPEQLAFYGIERGSKVKYVAGDLRGPGWYAARRTEADRARLVQSIHTIVGTVRLGRFLESIDEKCERCPFKSRCLTEGYAPMGAEKKALDKALAGLDFDGIGDEAA